MRLDPDDGNVDLIEVWPRHLVDAVSFPAAVRRHAGRCAQARACLQAMRMDAGQDASACFEFLMPKACSIMKQLSLVATDPQHRAALADKGKQLFGG